MEDAGCAKGCTIVVRDLFYNTPARMKFLKKDVSEANAVAGVMDRAALSIRKFLSALSGTIRKPCPLPETAS